MPTWTTPRSRRIEDAWHRYAVLVFPDQRLSDDEHLAFTRRFGHLERGLARRHAVGLGRMSNVDKDGRVVDEEDIQARFQRGNRDWHTDSSYKRVGAKASILAAHVVPEEGGETEWADMRAGWDALDDCHAALADRTKSPSTAIASAMLGTAAWRS